MTPGTAISVGIRRGRKAGRRSAWGMRARAVLVLKRDEQGLGWPGEDHGPAEHQGRPQQRVNPERRGEQRLHQDAEPDHQAAQDQDDEGGSAVTRVMAREIGAAARAMLPYGQETSVERPFPAGG